MQAEPYRSLYHGKVQPSDPQKFWSDLARLFLDWIEPFSKAFEKDENGIMRWFIDGKVNASGKGYIYRLIASILTSRQCNNVAIP